MSKVSSEHWEQVKELFERALEYSGPERAQFIQSACGDNVKLRQEVLSLLRSYDSADSFMETPAVHSAAESLLGHADKLVSGQRIRNFEIISALGEGGMGEVYLAKDRTLGRHVALKLLPQYLRSDTERLRRFKQEARTASTLSHPHVCVIHEVGETDDGRPFIAMEYIDGITLRQRLNEGDLTLNSSLDIAAQVAEALAAAHESGIIHRDIKPENIMIRRDGYVKVLDFGLAKFSDKRPFSGDTSVSTLIAHSTPGMVMGTVAYMSPEQARGIGVDTRTDIWSLGVVLYEMVAGRPPFEGTTPTDVIVGIVEREQPPVAQRVPDVPGELERIVRKALRKERDDRYQLAREFGIDLKSLRKDLEVDSELDRSVAPALVAAREVRTATGRKAPARTAKWDAARATISGPRHGWTLVLSQLAVPLIGLAILLGFFVAYKIFRRVPEISRKRFERINFTKLTTNGNAVVSTISPDGKYAAYVMTENDKQSLWLRQVAIPGTMQIVGPKEGRYLGITFSPDGNFLYYGYVGNGESERPEIFRVPVLGNTVNAVKWNATNGPQKISHDGKLVAFFHYDENARVDVLKIANADGTNERDLLTKKWPDRIGWDWAAAPAWIAGDKGIVLATVTRDASGSYRIGMIELDVANPVERPIPLTEKKFELLGHVGVLTDGSGVILSGKELGASFLQVWILGRDGSARTITNDLSDYRELDLTADSRQILTVQEQILTNIWSVPSGVANKGVMLTSGIGRYFDLSETPDGKILYASDASGSADIYELDANGQVKQLTSGNGRNYGPAVSPDGKYIAFHSNRSGIFQIWHMDRDGSNPVQLTSEREECNWAQFTADGQWIIYEHFAVDGPGGLWKVPVGGGKPESVAIGYNIRGTVSPDGKWLGFWHNNGERSTPWTLMAFSLETGATKSFAVAPTVQITWESLLRWTADSRNLCYVDHRGGVDNVWLQPIAGGSPRQGTDFRDSKIFSFFWRKDGALLVSRGVKTSDVVLLTDASQ